MGKLCECGCGKPAPIQTKSYWKFGYVKGQPSRFIRGHATKNKKYSPEIVEKLKKNGKKTQFKKGHKAFMESVQYIRPFQHGERHWNWKGGITPEVKRIRHCQEYRDWRKGVFEKDNYTCQKCKKKGGYLEADHYPILFSTLFSEKNWTKMWNINNGRTLCRPCHDETKRKRKI